MNASGGADYTRIQDAINNSNNGDTILVYSGTYYENVDVNKQLTLRGIDTGGGMPVVDAGGSGSAITLSAGWSTLEGFNAENGSGSWGEAGINVNSNNNIIKNNNASNNNNGISIWNSDDNKIYHNNVINNTNQSYDNSGTNLWDSGYPSGGNLWSDYKGAYPDGDGIGDTPYNIDGDAGAQDRYQFMIQNGWLPPSGGGGDFDTGFGGYPSIMGTHNGTLRLNHSINVSKLYNYPSPGTGGHSEYAAFYYPNGTLLASASWSGYSGDWHNITFAPFTLEAGVTYT